MSNSKAITINTHRVEDVCRKLEDRLRNVQLEGLLDRELQICILIGKKYWQLGDTDRAYLFLQSALEIALSIEDAKNIAAAYDLILNLSLDHNLCQSQLIEYIDGRNSFASISIEYSFYVLAKILFSDDDTLLLLCGAINSIKGYVRSILDGKCMWFACSILLNFIMFGSIQKSDLDRLHVFSSRFSCITCDLLTHIRIFHTLGDVCISQEIDGLASAFYELALSLSNSSEFTEHIYVTCLLRLAKLYAVEGQIELAWTTVYVAKDLTSKAPSILAHSIRALSKDLENLSVDTNAARALLSIGAVKRALDNQLSGISFDRCIAMCRKHYRVNELIESSRLRSNENMYVILKLLWLQSLEDESHIEPERVPEVHQSPTMSAKVLLGLGLRYLILGQSIEFMNVCNDLRSLVKAQCISNNHDHSFSYFLSRGASKSLLKLVDGYKMDTKSTKKSHGLVIEPHSRKRIEESVVDERPSKKSLRVTFIIHIAHRIFEFAFNSDTMEVSTIGWLKSQISRDILDSDCVGGDLGDVLDEELRIYRNHDMLIKIYKNNVSKSKIDLTTSFSPSFVDADKLGSVLQLSSEEKDWLRHSFCLNSQDLGISFYDNSLAEKLIPIIQQTLRWLSIDSCLEIRSFSSSRSIDFTGFKSCCLQGNLMEIDDLSSCIFLNISSCAHKFETLEMLSSKLSASVKRLEVADCGLLMNMMSQSLGQLAYLDISFSVIPDISKLFKSIADNCPSIDSIVLDGMECKVAEKSPIGNFPLHQLTHVSVGFSATGLFPCLVLEMLTAPHFKGTIDIRHSNIVGYEDRLTRALLNTAFSNLDLTDVVSEKEIVVKSSFM